MSADRTLSFILDDAIVTIDFSPGSGLSTTTSVLNYLRGLPGHKGEKEECTEGDSCTCTKVIREQAPRNPILYPSVDSCLVFLPMLQGKALFTVENLRDGEGEYHPVQKAMVATGGSQCGYCTPGIVMSLFALYKNAGRPSRETIDDALTGNL